MLDVIKKGIDIFFDKTVGLLSKIIYFLILVISIFLLNDIFGFSYNYQVSKKIENISKIEELKNNYTKDYSMSTSVTDKINQLENTILNRKPFIYTTFSYVQNVTLGKIKIDFWYLVSVHWFWIFIILIMIPHTYKNGFGEMLAMLLLVFVLMGLWYYFTKFLYGFIGIDSRDLKLWLNYIIFILLGILLAIIGKKQS